MFWSLAYVQELKETLPCSEYVYRTELLHCKLEQRVDVLDVFTFVKVIKTVGSYYTSYP
jgi:hypothetical protein